MKRTSKTPPVTPILSFALIGCIFSIAALMRHGGANDVVNAELHNIGYVFIAAVFVTLARLNADNAQRISVLAAFLAGGMFFGSFFPFIHNELLGHGIIARYMH